MPKRLFLACFELVVARKSPKCLENGLFWDKKWVKDGSKMILDHLGCPNK